MLRADFRLYSSPRRVPAARKPLGRSLLRPDLESLEDRTAPALATWTGGGATTAWTNPANWAANIAPSAGDDLLFPAGAAKASAVNDFAPGTGFRSLTFSGPGYTVSGNALSLQAGNTRTQVPRTNTGSKAIKLGSVEAIRAFYTQ